MKQADSLLLNALKAAIHNEKAALGVLLQETQTELLRRRCATACCRLFLMRAARH